MTACMPCSFGLLLPQVRGGCPPHWPPPFDRECPPDTARDRYLWHAGGTADENDDARASRYGSQLGWRVRPVLGDHRLVGKRPKGSRQPGWETRTPARLLKCAWWRRCWQSDLWFLSPVVTARARCSPLSAGSPCTHCVPAGCGPVRSQTLRCSVLHDARGSTAITPPVAVVLGWAARTELGHQ
jgi:hypothetical protein